MDIINAELSFVYAAVVGFSPQAHHFLYVFHLGPCSAIKNHYDM